MLRLSLRRLGPPLLILVGLTGCDDTGRTGSGGTTRPDAGFFTRDSGVITSPMDSGVPPMAVIQVGRVLDGDTIILNANASVLTPDGRPMNDEHVRMLGVDAPEIAHPPTTTMPDCWGDESHAAARELMQGLRVELEFGSPLRDMFGRLLAYVRLPDGRIANEVLIRQGDARSFSFSHRDKRKYDDLEAQARRENRGVWTCP
jgi:endonuclease YncB( thermonuclease family)